MIEYFDTFFSSFTTLLGYIGTHYSEYPVLLYVIALVTIASAVDYIRKLYFI